MFPAGVDLDTLTNSGHSDICICEKGPICKPSGTRAELLKVILEIFWLWQLGLQLCGELNAPHRAADRSVTALKKTGWVVSLGRLEIC